MNELKKNIKPIPGQELPTTKYSKKRVQFECHCGSIFTTSWSDYSDGKTQSCGHCKFFTWKKSKQTVFGQLKLLTPISEITKLTQIVDAICKCGVHRNLPLVQMTSGKAKSCGCSRKKSISESLKTAKVFEIQTKEYWLNKYPNLINENLPEKWSEGSSKKFKFICKCGKTFIRKFCKYKPEISICGHCTEIYLEKGTMVNGFTYDDVSRFVNTNSDTTELYFICPCGRRELARVRVIFNGEKKSCYKCNLIYISLDDKFGRLRIAKEIYIKKYSDKPLLWLCECGNDATIVAHNVIDGTTKSCGRCKERIDQWWIENQSALINLVYPISKDSELFRPLNLLEDVLGPRVPFKSLCPICKNIHTTVMDSIRKGGCLTCGCTTSTRISQAQRDIYEYLLSFGVETKLEYIMNNLRYDIYVPSIKLLIEYHGLKWHSIIEAKQRDLNKYENAVNSQYNFICVFEDEWANHKNAVKAILANKLKTNKNFVKSLRPSQCEIKEIKVNEADKFYEENHYIGQCKSNINFGVFFENQLIACVSFKHPNRQSRYDYELVRMTSVHEFRVHGIWSKLMKIFIEKYKPKSIVSFSDNRIFSGGVYEKIGFKFDGNVPRDYYWTKDKRRFNKSGLRKPPGEIRTENDIRTEQGYSKIWDLGKKRWVFDIP